MWDFFYIYTVCVQRKVGQLELRFNLYKGNQLTKIFWGAHMFLDCPSVAINCIYVCMYVCVYMCI